MSWVKLKKSDDEAIGKKYQVFGLLGEGGFGRVYLVYSQEIQEILALKTYQEEFFNDPDIRLRFLKEARIWMDMGVHPNIVRLFFIDSIGRRPYIAMEVISSAKGGQNTLEGFIKTKGVSISQYIIWAVQFCEGMEYAYSKGLKAHRDIKPANIMIGPDKILKISDFGLASALKPINGVTCGKYYMKNKLIKLSFSTKRGDIFGTPPYMSPEQFDDSSSCDVKSDVYSFGIVLFQMINEGALPFDCPIPEDSVDASEYWRIIENLHKSASIPYIDSPLYPIIKKCLEKRPENRYQSFKELKSDLENVYYQLTGEQIKAPSKIEYTISDLINKGNSYARLLLYNDALKVYEQVLERDSNNAQALSCKGICLLELGYDADALIFFNKAIELDPKDSLNWMNLGNYYYWKKDFDTALINYAKARDLDPTDSLAWSNAGTCCLKKGQYLEALFYLDKAIALDPDLVETIGNKGIALLNLDRYEDAMDSFDAALKIDPIFLETWHNKGICYSALKKHNESIKCFDHAIELNSNFIPAITSKGYALMELGNLEEANKCFKKVSEIQKLSE